MATILKVPALGEDVDSVDVVRVLVDVGDLISSDQPVIEVETEKASVEVPSELSGRITELHVSIGDTLAAGAPILTIEEVEEEKPAVAVEEKPAEVGPQEAEVAQTEPLAGPGATITEEEVSAPVQTGEQPPGTGGQELLAPLWSVPESPRTLVPAAPTVRRFAREIGVDISQVGGSGPGGRISIDDVKAHAARTMAQISAGANGVSQPALPDFAVWGPVRREPMTRIRKVTARNMARAWVQVPQVTNNDWADITRLEEMRKQYRARVEAAGGKLTITSMLVKVVASALKAFPNLNSSVDMEGHEVIHKDYVHVGVAVDTDRGLLVPVIRDADTKNMTAISVELDDLARRARDRKLRPEEMQGGSFSISNLGGIGGTGFSPIVNWPEVAILGVSRGLVEPRWVDGVFEPRLILPLSLSYDHRLVDGAEAARFLRWIAEALEQPLLLALEG